MKWDFLSKNEWATKKQFKKIVCTLHTKPTEPYWPISPNDPQLAPMILHWNPVILYWAPIEHCNPLSHTNPQPLTHNHPHFALSSDYLLIVLKDLSYQHPELPQLSTSWTPPLKKRQPIMLYDLFDPNSHLTSIHLSRTSTKHLVEHWKDQQNHGQNR